MAMKKNERKRCVNSKCCREIEAVKGSIQCYQPPKSSLCLWESMKKY